MNDKEYNEPVDTNEKDEMMEADGPISENNPWENQHAETAKLEGDLQEQKDKYIRLFAEFENYKRRTSKEIFEIRQTASRDLITTLLDVLDDVDRVEKLNNESEEDDKLPDGILLIFTKFRKILESKGLRAIETMHTEFDVEKDEAISEIPVDEKKLKGKVVAEVQKGYMLNDKLIRFAKVVVGK